MGLEDEASKFAAIADCEEKLPGNQGIELLKK
jgi:hypothetical protein